MDGPSPNSGLEDDMSLDNSITARKARPKKRSLVERELETNLTSRITSPIANGDTQSKSRYGRARNVKSDNSHETDRKVKSKSPKTDKSPVKSPGPVIKMFASNSPMKSESQTSITKSPIENRIESIYNETVSLSRFSNNEKKPSPKKGKVYTRKDLIQRKEKEQTVNIIKNMFSPVKSPYKCTSNHLNNILERSSEKYNLKNDASNNGYLEKTTVVKTLNFDSNQNPDNVEVNKDMNKNEIADLEASCPYDVGDLTWARIGSYPFWPCIVTRDPYSDMFVKKRVAGRGERNVVHVTFFGDNGRRGWVPENMLRQYLGQLEFEGTRENFSAEDKKKDPKLYAAFFISEKKQRKWHISVEEAESFLREPKNNRLDMLYDMLIKIKGIKTTPVRDKSANVARKDSDVSLSETLLDTLFSEDDSKTDDIDRFRNKARKKSLDVSDVVTACLDNMAAKTGIITIKKQSHMDRWLQKAKSKTPEKSQSEKPTNDDKKKKKKDIITNKPKSRSKLPNKTVHLNKTFPIFNLHELNNKAPNKSLLQNGIHKATNKYTRANSFDSVYQVVSSSEDESVKTRNHNKTDLNCANEVTEKTVCSEPINEVINDEQNSTSIYSTIQDNLLDSQVELTPEPIDSNDAEHIDNIQTVNTNHMEITLEVDRVQSPISISSNDNCIHILNVFSIEKESKNPDMEAVGHEVNDKNEYIESSDVASFEISMNINEQELTVDQNELDELNAMETDEQTINLLESEIKFTNEKSSIGESEGIEDKTDNEEKKQIDLIEVDKHIAVIPDDIQINETNYVNDTSDSEVKETKNKQIQVDKNETKVIDETMCTTCELITQISNENAPLDKSEPKEVNIEQKTTDLSDSSDNIDNIASQDDEMDEKLMETTKIVTPKSDNKSIQLDKPEFTDVDNNQRETEVEDHTSRNVEADISEVSDEAMVISEVNAKLDENLLMTVDLETPEAYDTTIGPDKPKITVVDNEVVHSSEQETTAEDQTFRTVEADISEVNDAIMVISELDPKLDAKSLQTVEIVTPASTIELDKAEIIDIDMDISQPETKVEEETFQTAEAEGVDDEVMFIYGLKSKLDEHQPTIEIAIPKSAIDLDKPEVIDIVDEDMYIPRQKININKQTYQTAKVVAIESDNQIIDLENLDFNDSPRFRRTRSARPRLHSTHDAIIDLDNDIMYVEPASLKEQIVELDEPKSATVDDDVVYVTDLDPLDTTQTSSMTVHLEEITPNIEKRVTIIDTENAKVDNETDLLTVADLVPAKITNVDDVSLCVTDLIDKHTNNLDTMEIDMSVTELKIPKKDLNKSVIKVNEIQPDHIVTSSPKRVLRNRSDADKLPKSDSPIEFNKDYEKFNRSYDDPEFLKYMELSQDALMDENPHLTHNEIVAYLYRTWIFDQDQKSDVVRHDDVQDSNFVKGLNEETTVQVKKPKKKIKVGKEAQFTDEAPNREKNTRKKVVKPFYTELYDSDSDSEVYELDSSAEINTDVANADVFIDEYDEMNFYLEQLTKTKPNVFKGLIRERLCEICEKPSRLVKCKGLCGGYFHVDCVNKEATPAEDQNLLPTRKKKKSRGRKSKTSDDNDSRINGTDSESQDDKSQDNISLDDQSTSFDKLEYTSHIVTNLDDFETQLSSKMKELLENNQENTSQYSSDEELDWKDTVAGKCEIVDIKQKSKKDENSEPIGYSDFKCHNCLKHQTPLCSICKSTLSPKTQSEFRQRCNVAHCQKYYHLDCLDHWPQAHFLEPSRNNKKTSEQFEALTCPRHVCHTCVSDDPRGCKTRFCSDKLAKCVRCPAVYHSFTKCLPAGSQILNASNIICPRHNEFRPGKAPIHVNTGWCFICALGGTLICCEYCPTSFHAECLNIDPPEGGYMCEDCETGRLPLYGEMVWVKLGHYRWWPGIILHPVDVPDNIRVMKHSQGEFVVRFFGQYDHYWVNRGRVFPFQEGDSGKVSSQKSKIDADFTKAMEHAQKACEILKNAAADEVESQDIQSSLLPPRYVKLKVNKPIGAAVKCKVDVSEANSLTQCECDPNDFDPCGPDSQCLNRMLLTECGPTCRAGERCNNRSFERRAYPKMVPYRTPQRGWGLKTLEDIKRGQFVIEYVGELIDEEEFRRRMGRKHEIRDENFYFLTLDKDRMIDAGPKGNLARFMNHCCEPNCETQKWTVLGDVRVGLFALHDIQANTEVTFNYNLECAGIEKKQCMCGAKRCSGYIGAKPKQDEKVKSTKRVYNKKRKVTNQESPSTSSKSVKPAKPKITIKIKPRELTEIEKDLLIIKSATNGISSDSESNERTIAEKDSIISKDRKAMKRKRVSFSTEEVVIFDSGISPVEIKKVKYDESVENGPV